jgi:ABC-type transporter Mla subunit MlaD
MRDGERRFFIEMSVGVQPSLAIYDDANAVVKQDGFLGPKFVALFPGVSGTPLPAGAAIPGRAEPVLSDLMEEVKEPVARLNGVLSELQNLLGSTKLPENLDQLTIEARRLVIALRESALPKAERLIEDLDSNVARVGDRLDESLSGITDEARRLVGIVDARAARLDGLIGEAEGLLADARSGVNRVADGLEKTAAGIDGVSAGAERLLTDNNRNVYLAIRNLRDATAELDRLLRKVRANPSVLVWGDDEPVEATPPPPDLETLRERGRARRYGKEPGK